MEDLTYIGNVARGNIYGSRLASLQSDFFNSNKLFLDLQKRTQRHEETDEFGGVWTQSPRRPVSCIPGVTQPQRPFSDVTRHTVFHEHDIHAATLPAAFAAPKRAVSSSGGGRAAAPGVTPPGGGFVNMRDRPPSLRCAEESEFDALTRPFVPIPHLFDERPPSALYRQKTDIELWRGEVEKRVPERRPLAVCTKLTPTKHAHLSKVDFPASQRPVFRRARRAALPRNYVIDQEWFSEKASLQNAVRYESKPRVFGWTK